MMRGIWIAVGMSAAAAVWLGLGAWAREGQPRPMPAATILRSDVVPIGSLGKPLGAYVTISGTRHPSPAKSAAWVLLVDTVDGKRLPRPVVLWIENIGRLPAGQRVRIKGYESVRMVGVPPAYATASREDGLKPPAWTLREDVAWQMELYFHAIKVVSPEHLAIKRGKGGQ